MHEGHEGIRRVRSAHRSVRSPEIGPQNTESFSQKNLRKLRKIVSIVVQSTRSSEYFFNCGLVFIVPVLEPVKQLVAIKIGDNQCDNRNHGDYREGVVLLIPDSRPLHGEKVSAWEPADDRHE